MELYKEEKAMLSYAKCERINSLAEKLGDFAHESDVEKTWEHMELVHHLYGKEIDGIEILYNQSIEHGGTLLRNAIVVAELLNNYVLDQTETNDYYESTLKLLEPFTKAYGFYQAGLDKYRAAIFERNMIDDIRQAFEILVKNITKIEKSLENQKGSLGQQLEGINENKYARDMFMKFFSAYVEYQNNIIKHQQDSASNVDTSSSEVCFVMDISSAFIRYLIKALAAE